MQRQLVQRFYNPSIIILQRYDSKAIMHISLAHKLYSCLNSNITVNYMPDSNFTRSTRIQDYVEHVRSQASELVRNDDLLALLSTNIHFLEVVRKPLFVALSDLDKRYLLEDIVHGLLVNKIYPEESFLRKIAGSGAGVAEQLQALRQLREPLEAIVNQVNSPHLVEGWLSQSIQLLDNRIRDLRRRDLEAGEFGALDLAEIDFKAAIPSLVHFHRLGVERDLIVFETDVRTDKVVLLDRRRLNALCDNLILNSTESVKKALEQSKRKTGLIATSVSEKRNRNGEFLEISVRDNGLGIREVDRQTLSERPTIGNDGRGLGLWAVAKIVRFYHGEVAIKSSLECGTSVSVTLNMGMIPVVSNPTRELKQERGWR